MHITVTPWDYVPGKQRPVYTLELPLNHSVSGFDMYPLLNWLFRQLNRVDGDELISLLGIPAPSMSVGDLVHFRDNFGTRGFRCTSEGWIELDSTMEENEVCPTCGKLDLPR